MLDNVLVVIQNTGRNAIYIFGRIQEKNPHKMSSQEKTSQKSPVEKSPHPNFRLEEKTPQLYKKPSFWNFDIFYLNCIQTPHPSTL